MEQQAKYFMKNVIIKGLLYAYMKMKKDIYLEGFLQFLGQVMVILMKLKIHLYLL